MSNRSRKNVRRGKVAPMRGPSRPIDPRYAPGGPPRRRIDTVGIAIITISGLALAVLLLVLVTQTRGVSAIPAPTQTAIAFATQTSPDAVPRIGMQDTKALYDAGNVTMIDVRDKQFYDVGHIKGAINIPQAQVAQKLGEIPKSGNVVLYCQ